MMWSKLLFEKLSSGKIHHAKAQMDKNKEHEINPDAKQSNTKQSKLSNVKRHNWLL